MGKYLIHIRMVTIFKKTESKSVCKNVEKLEFLHSVDRSTKWCSWYGKQYWGYSKKLNLDIAFDPAIPLLGLHTKALKAETQTGIYIPTFTAVLFVRVGNKLNVHQ